MQWENLGILPHTWEPVLHGGQGYDVVQGDSYHWGSCFDRIVIQAIHSCTLAIGETGQEFGDLID